MNVIRKQFKQSYTMEYSFSCNVTEAAPFVKSPVGFLLFPRGSKTSHFWEPSSVSEVLGMSSASLCGQFGAMFFQATMSWLQ